MSTPNTQIFTDIGHRLGFLSAPHRRGIGTRLSSRARRQLRPQLISRQSGSLSSCKRGFKTQATLGRRKRNPRPQFGRGTGRDADAKAAVAELLKLKPGYTVEQWADCYARRGCRKGERQGSRGSCPRTSARRLAKCERPLSPHSNRSGTSPELLLRSCSDLRLDDHVGRKSESSLRLWPALLCNRGRNSNRPTTK
jgi:hypothetical protein